MAAFSELLEKASRAARLVVAAVIAPMAPPTAATPWELRISEYGADAVRIEVRSTCVGCNASALPEVAFDPSSGISKVGSHLFERRLDDEIDDTRHHYLMAARHGRGIYLHLPYFCPTVGCEQVTFVLAGAHVLFGDLVHPGELRVPGWAARQTSAFVTNEPRADFQQAVYIDPSLSPTQAKELRNGIAQVAAFYRQVLGVDALRSTGVVAVVVRNGKGYSGFGGDALNIIRLSFDNPRPDDLPHVPRVLVDTFAHELAHRVQAEALHDLPMGRFVTEGGAEYLRVLALRETGQLDAAGAKLYLRRARAACAHVVVDPPVAERMPRRQVAMREPYDCGLMYYLAAQRVSGLQRIEFARLLLAAFAGDAAYDAPAASRLCLRFEPTCADERLRRLLGTQSQVLAELSWLADEMEHW